MVRNASFRNGVVSSERASATYIAAGAAATIDFDWKR